MSTDILLPILGESISEATIARWLKKPGDSVKRGEVIAELETAKATMDLECPENGILESVLVNEGEKVTIGQRLAIISRPGQTNSPTPQPLPVQSSPQETSVPISAPENSSFGRRISPAARKRAQELGISIDDIPVNSPESRLTSDDVDRFAASLSGASDKANPLPSHRIILNEMRKMTAKRMTESAQTIPQYSVSIDSEMQVFNTVLAETRKILDSKNIKCTVTSLLLFLTCRALLKHPMVNSRFDQETIEVFDTINMALATSTPDGLVTPVIHNAEKYSFTDLCIHSNDLIQRAQKKNLNLTEICNGTFTLSSLGMYGISQFTPLINPPQAAILGVGAIRQVGHGNDSGNAMTLTLTSDHRVINGAEAAGFLSTLKNEIEFCDLNILFIQEK